MVALPDHKSPPEPRIVPEIRTAHTTGSKTATTFLRARPRRYGQSVYNPAMSTTAAATGTLEGTIERVTYHNADNGFAVIQLKVSGRRDLVPVVGHLASASAGEFLEATGRWVVDKQHGQQFKADSMRTTHPATPEGMEKYLGSGFIKGIGPVFAGKLVQVFSATNATRGSGASLHGHRTPRGWPARCPE